MKVSRVAGVVNAPSLVFNYETTVAAMVVAKRAGSPMFAGNERNFPILVRKTFPPLELDDAFEAEIQCKITDSSGHHANFRSG